MRHYKVIYLAPLKLNSRLATAKIIYIKNASLFCCLFASKSLDLALCVTTTRVEYWISLCKFSCLKSSLKKKANMKERYGTLSIKCCRRQSDLFSCRFLMIIKFSSCSRVNELCVNILKGWIKRINWQYLKLFVNPGKNFRGSKN